MPRHNASTRRSARRPEPEQTETAVSFEALARELVRRGLRSSMILDHPPTPPKEA